MARLAYTLGLTSALFSAAVRSYDEDYYELEITDTVQADVSTTVTISLDDDDDDDDGFSDGDDSYSGYRIYLATTPPGWLTAPACYLVNDTAIGTTQVQVTIPASAAADQTTLSLTLGELYDGFSLDSYAYSNDFVLEGGTGDWSALELNGYSITEADVTPCSALQCARDCADQYYGDGIGPEDISDPSYEDYYNCVASCPGVDMPAWDDVWSDDGGDDGGDGDGSSFTYTHSSFGGHTSTRESAQATKTASATTSAATSTTASATSTSAASASASVVTTSSASRQLFSSSFVLGVIAAAAAAAAALS